MRGIAVFRSRHVCAAQYAPLETSLDAVRSSAWTTVDDSYPLVCGLRDREFSDWESCERPHLVSPLFTQPLMPGKVRCICARKYPALGIDCGARVSSLYMYSQCPARDTYFVSINCVNTDGEYYYYHYDCTENKVG